MPGDHVLFCTVLQSLTYTFPLPRNILYEPLAVLPKVVCCLIFFPLLFFSVGALRDRYAGTLNGQEEGEERDSRNLQVSCFLGVVLVCVVCWVSLWVTYAIVSFYQHGM